MRFTYFIPAIIWLIISTILLTIPGNDLPHNAFFDIPYFDKYVHLGMFTLLTALFCMPFLKFKTNESIIKRWFFIIAFGVILYGIAMEFVQKYFTFERSFDITDILFDSLGSFTGLFFITQFVFKKIGPNGNRGRNQN